MRRHRSGVSWRLPGQRIPLVTRAGKNGPASGAGDPLLRRGVTQRETGSGSHNVDTTSPHLRHRFARPGLHRRDRLDSTGTAGGTGTGTGTGGTATSGAAGTTGAAGGSVTGVAGNPATGAGGTTVVPPDPSAAGPMPVRRLTAREYVNTVRDLLTDTTSVAIDDVPGEADDISNNAFPFRQPTPIGTTDANNLQTAAETLAKNVATRLSTVLPCTPANAAAEAGCANQFITSFGLKAYRRPLATAEVTSLTTLYQAARTTLALDFNGAIGVLIEAMLQSPAFVYHWEVDPGAAIRDGARRPARQLPGRESPVVLPVGLDARHDAVRRRRRGTAVDARGHRDAGPAHAGGHEGPEHGRRLRRGLAGHQHHRAAAEGSGVLHACGTPTWSPRCRRRSGRSRPRTSWAPGGSSTCSPARHRRSNQALAAIYGVTGVTGTAPRAVTFDATQRGGHPDARRLPGRQRRQRRLVAGPSRSRRVDAPDVRRGPRPARQRAAARCRRRRA